MDEIAFNLDKNLSNKKKLQLFFLGFIGLSLTALFISFLLGFYAGLTLTDEAITAYLTSPLFYSSLNALSYSIILILMVLVLYPHLQAMIQEYVSIHIWLKGIGYGFLVLFIAFGLNDLYAILNLSVADNENQTLITNLVENFPFISFLSFVLLGPIVEELTYRLGLFSFLKKRNRWLAYIVTVGLFAIIHFNFIQDNLTNELLNLPFYATAGLFFCWLYEKEGLAVATLAHITNNLISILSIILISNGLSS